MLVPVREANGPGFAVCINSPKREEVPMSRIAAKKTAMLGLGVLSAFCLAGAVAEAYRSLAEEVIRRGERE